MTEGLTVWRCPECGQVYDERILPLAEGVALIDGVARCGWTHPGRDCECIEVVPLQELTLLRERYEGLERAVTRLVGPLVDDPDAPAVAVTLSELRELAEALAALPQDAPK